jgi:hypothetical protein
MKNLGRTIDRIIKIDPALEDKLSPIRNKWRKAPSKAMDYWKELIDFLNSDPLMKHPKRDQIKNIITYKRSAPKQLYTFDEVTPNDTIIGVVPENIADAIRRHDVKVIRLAKLQVEANMTRNASLMAKISRQDLLMEIETRKIWLAVKDHFNLWDKPTNFSLKKLKNSLVLTEISQQPPQGMVSFPGVHRVDPNSFRKFLDMLGFEGGTQE